MAAVLKLSFDGTDLSFLDTSGMFLVDPGWIPKVGDLGADGKAGRVKEAILVEINGASYDDVGANEQALSDMMRVCRIWRQDKRMEAVWLHSKLDGETGERRALVHNISWRWKSQHYAGAMVSFSPRLTIIIERDGAWEQLADTPDVDIAAVATVGGMLDYTVGPGADVVGTLPARLSKLETWANAADLGVLWGGFRSDEKHGDAGAFDPVLNIEGLTSVGADTADVGDATAENGTRTDVDFTVTEGWGLRKRGFVTAIGNASIEEESSPFLMIVRAYCDAATEAEIKISHNNNSTIADTSSEQFTEAVAIDANAWTFYPLVGLWDNFRAPHMRLYARRTAGAGELHMDVIVFMPTDEYFIFGEQVSMIGNPAVGFRLTLETFADGIINGYSGSLNYSGLVSNVEATGPGVPIGDGRLVVCAARDNRVSVLTDTLTVRTAFFPRWAALRGAE